jgi:hypothetical protein
LREHKPDEVPSSAPPEDEPDSEVPNILREHTAEGGKDAPAEKKGEDAA